MLCMGCLTFGVTKVLTESLVGKVEWLTMGEVRGRGRRPFLYDDGEGGCCTAVVANAVEAVSSLKLVRVVRIVHMSLCTHNKCEAMAVDMINPGDWSK